jgi:Sortilin, neurotensin receptor 3,
MHLRKLPFFTISAAACALFALAATGAAQSPYETAMKNLRFRSIGPAVMGGRTDDIAVVESDPRIIYIGAAGGGLFKSINGGTTWQALWEDQPNPSIGDIAISPSNPAILYVGTGEANNRQSSSWGDGIYKSTDAGATWTHLGLKETHHIGRIVVHPTNPDLVYVAAQGDLWGPNKERGVFMSKDGGATWSQTLTINEDTGVSDIAIDPQSPNILFACAYERRRTVFGFNGGGPGSGLYRSTDGGLHWTKMGTGGIGRGLPQGEWGRSAVEVYRKNSNIVYTLVEHATLGGVYRSEDRGATWARMSDTNPRPSYFSQLRIDPNNDQKIWLGGVNIYMSEDGGRTFSQTRFRNVHSDVHAIWIDPSNSDHLLSGNDGGVWSTWDSGRNWEHFNNIALGQFYEVAFDYQKPYHVCGGLQDNYSWCGPSTSLQSTGIGNADWITVEGGDGFYNRIDPTDPNIIYAESQDGSLSRRDLKTSESKSIRPQEDNDQSPRYRFQWNSPLLISAHDPKTIYYGGNYLFKSTDRGDNWIRLGNDLTTAADRDKMTILGKLMDRATAALSRDDGVATWPCITVIAESPVKAGVLWAGTDDGNVQMSKDDGKTWQNVVSHIAGLPKMSYVSRIEPSHTDAGTAYITFDDHRSGDFAIYAYVTRNYGDSFTKITNGIPPEAGTVHVLREDPVNPNLLFAGTEFGLFASWDKGANWHRMKNGLPTVPVFDIQIHPREHDLILATHGRSVWIMDNISALEQLNDQVLSSDLKFFEGRPGIQWKMANYRGFEGANMFFTPNAQGGLLLDFFAKSAGQVRIAITDAAGKPVRQMNAQAQAGSIVRTAWDMRADSPVAAAGGGGARGAGGGGRGAGGGGAAGGAGGGGRGAGGGGRGGRGGGAGGNAGGGAAATPPAAVAEGGAAAAGAAGAAGAAAGGGADLGGELNADFGAAGGAGGGGGGGGRGFGGGRGGGGSLVDPGEYTVTLTANGKSESHKVTVEDDPRVVMSSEDRAKKRTAIETLISLTRDAEAPRRKAVAMTTALTNLQSSWNAANAAAVPDEVKKAVDALSARVKTAAAYFEAAGGGGRGGGGGGAGARGDFVPPPVTQKIQRLMGSIDGYSSAPTARQLADLEEAKAELAKGTAAVDAVWDDVPKLNKLMTDAGVTYFRVDLNAVQAAPAGGRGGGN